MSRCRLWLFAAALLAASCGPQLPPATVPQQTRVEYDGFGKALQDYVTATQPYRKDAAVTAESVPGKATAGEGAAASVRARSESLAGALQSKLRPNAKPGDIFGGAADLIRADVERLFAGPQRDLLTDALAEQNDEGKADPRPVTINEHLGAPRVPPLLIEALPPLPKQLEYAFVGRTLLLRDVDADVVIDYLPDVLPELARAGVPTVTSVPEGGTPAAVLPLPSLRGGTIFALIGDSGSGDRAQVGVAQAMLGYFESARRFSFVLMLGDNLYHDDYANEFSMPYKALLDRGVKFYAALGNHDRNLETHFKPFNMGDKDYYSFDQGNARFAVLNSNHPTDPMQAKWLDGVFTDAGTKWRIAFFHHPLFSSGQHAAESRDVIRPALEPILLRNKVDVVFGGHEHLYERIAAQKGIRYFVSGGGGRSLYAVKASEFDQVAISDHHFMVVEIAGDRLFYEAVTSNQRLLDCGVLWRTTDAAAKPDDDTTKWNASCQAAINTPPPRVVSLPDAGR